MQTLAVTAAGIAGIVHIGFWVAESLLWRRPRVHRVFGVKSEADAAATAFALFNQGFYNLAIGIGTIVGIGLAVADRPSGIPVIVFGCSVMVVAALVLVTADRRLLVGALVQGLAPGLALVAIALS